jgi:hypothetical protein
MKEIKKRKHIRGNKKKSNKQRKRKEEMTIKITTIKK